MILAMKINGLNELVTRLKNHPKIAGVRISEAINQALAEMHKNATDEVFQFRTPRSKRTGFLAKSFAEGLRKATPSRLVGYIGPTVFYAKWVNDGTVAHTISPKNKPFLAWNTGGNRLYVQSQKSGRHYYRKVVKDNWVFTKKSVQHPGTKANPFMQRIMVRSKSSIDNYFKTALEKITQEIGG